MIYIILAREPLFGGRGLKPKGLTFCCSANKPVQTNLYTSGQALLIVD